MLDAAKAKAYRLGENPARWRGHLDHLLPKQLKLARSHHAAMPYEYVAAFVGRLRENDTLTAQALELTILTAARSGEILGLRWSSSISIKGLGHCPRGRMKGDVSTVCRSPSVRRRSDPATWSGDRLSNRGIDIARPVRIAAGSGISARTSGPTRINADRVQGKDIVRRLVETGLRKK